MKTPVRAFSASLVLSAALALAGCAQDAESALNDDAQTTSPDPFVQAQGEVPAGELPGAAAEPSVPAGPAPAAAIRRPVRRADGSSAPATASASPRTPAFIAAGTSISATVDEELTTERTREGDRFHARLSEDVLGANGEVLLPAGAVLNGRVTTSHQSTGAQDPAALELEVGSITAAGRTLPLAADVVEVEAKVSTRDSNAETATKVAVGAAAGALMGRILGKDRESTVKGTVAGAVAGGAVAAATRSGHAVVKPGARMVVRLTERLVVEP